MDKHEVENMNFWGMRLDEHEVQDNFYSESEKKEQAHCFDALFNRDITESLVTMPGMKSMQCILPGSGFHKELLYSKMNRYNSKNSADEARLLISTACMTCINGMELKGSDEISLCDQTFSHLKMVSNYEIISIHSVQNTNLKAMHDTFNVVHQIGKPRTVYHGSTGKSIANIAKTGFRGSACSRSKHGRGIYTSSNLWEALSYAEPEKDTLYQSVIVTDLLQGPTIMGTQDLVEFGFNSANQEILTSTNAENTIFCAARESQLLTKYIIVFKFDQTAAHGEDQNVIIKFYNIAIWALIRKNHIPSAASSDSNVLLTVGAGFQGHSSSMAALARNSAKQSVLKHMAATKTWNTSFSARVATSLAAVTAANNSATNTGNALFSAHVSMAMANAVALNISASNSAFPVPISGTVVAAAAAAKAQLVHQAALTVPVCTTVVAAAAAAKAQLIHQAALPVPVCTTGVAAASTAKALLIHQAAFPVLAGMPFQRPLAPFMPTSVMSSVFSRNEPIMRHIESHNNISIGDSVRICKNLKDMDFVINRKGIVRSILKQKFVKFYVEIDDSSISLKMNSYHQKSASKMEMIEKFKLDMKWVPCNLGQIILLRVEAQHLSVNTACVGQVGIKRPISLISIDDP